MFAHPALKTQRRKPSRIPVTLLPVLFGGDIGSHQNLSQGQDVAVIRQEPVFDRNLVQSRQHKLTRWGNQQIGGRAPPGAGRCFPACQREHRSTALASKAEAICKSGHCRNLPRVVARWEFCSAFSLSSSLRIFTLGSDAERFASEFVGMMMLAS